MAFTEGRKTEPSYLLHWYRLFRDRAIVVIDDFHGGPLQLVEKARDRRENDLRDQRRGRGQAFSEYWCVFDVDEHHGLDQAIDLATKNEIRLAVSNPCIELWFALHFQDQWASLDRTKAQDIAKTLLSCGKTPTAQALEQLVARHDEAEARARALDKKHDGDGSPVRSNPSSDVWRLVAQIRTPDGGVGAGNRPR
ncbi:RloB domain-containing protein [Nonomuraea sp. NN258]|uniref:RloB family protein n=1 Tax=Nonomuraea antri TaxID=2730852 RepID=UPI001569F075|nr:RloB family protein [Nonomuraea antri]NRQ39629.1 RloB domain-containing protein [Nonomuraea antri]